MHKYSKCASYVVVADWSTYIHMQTYVQCSTRIALIGGRRQCRIWIMHDSGPQHLGGGKFRHPPGVVFATESIFGMALVTWCMILEKPTIEDGSAMHIIVMTTRGVIIIRKLKHLLYVAIQLHISLLKVIKRKYFKQMWNVEIIICTFRQY